MAKLIQCSSEAETREVAKELAGRLNGGEILCLHGDLGTGKTVFTQFLAESLAVHEQVVSPTFVLLRSYNTQNEVIKTLHHLDAYRLESFEDFQGLGLDGLITDNSVVVIEWPEKVEQWLPTGKIVHISFENAGDNERKLRISNMKEAE